MVVYKRIGGKRGDFSCQTVKKLSLFEQLHAGSLQRDLLCSYRYLNDESGLL